ncbi:MAG: preprotein translocase subunit YajC [Bacteroidia bacterium]|nr:preprotein translocase subunit YajC [Bacteroidia bacterium]
MNQFSHLLLESGASEQSANAGIMQFVFFAGIIAIFYFFMIRPQQKKAKEEKVFRESLGKGDKVMTIGGIYGIIESLEGSTALVRVDQNTKLRFDKTSLRAQPADAKTAEEAK